MLSFRPPLGQLLIGQRLITQEQLAAGLASQVISGGRLGTNLIEAEFVSIDHVALALGEQHGVPAASQRAFEAVRSSALGAMPRELCLRTLACPLLLDNQTLHVAFRDPDQLAAVDAVGRTVGLTILPYATPELRLLYYLEKHYHLPRPTRYLRTEGPSRRQDRRHYLASTVEPPAADRPQRPADGAENVRRAPASPAPTVPNGPSLTATTDSGTFDLEIVEQRLAEVTGSRGDAQALAEVLEALQGAPSREALVRELLRPVLPDTSLVVLFLLRGSSALALGAWGAGAPEEARDLVMPTSASPLLQRALSVGEVVAAAPDSLQRQIAARLGTRSPKKVFVAAVWIDQVPVNLLCIHSTGRLSDEEARGRVEQVATAAAAAYRRLLSPQGQTLTVPTRVSASRPARPALWAGPDSWAGSAVARPLSVRRSDELHLGRYELICRFASGGMANLYLARMTGPDDHGKLVAIKRIHEHLCGDASFVQRFEDEARLAARINHPHVVRVIEFGRVDRSHFIAMEFVEGESLAALLNSAAPSWPVAARIIADAAAGLHAAHELRSETGQLLQVVHRDVSPHNLLIGYDGVVKVVDFGVAHARSNLHTSFVGVIAGKPAYMAPEQARGGDLDRRVDVFALGIILHEMTTQRRLFQSDSQAATLIKVLTAEVPLPSRLVPGYPPALEQIVMTALNRAPDARFDTALHMQTALERYIEGTGAPVTAASLAKIMRSVFAERIAQKSRFLDELATGLFEQDGR